MTRRKKQEPPKEIIKSRKRGRPKKITEPVVEEISDEIEKVASSATRRGGGKIVLRHFTEEEIIVENKRKRVMWVSVAFVAMLVLFVWAANLKRIVSVDAAGNGGSLISLSDFTSHLSKNFKQINSSISALKNEVASSSDSKLATTSETYDTNIREINKQLKEMIINASTTINNK